MTLRIATALWVLVLSAGPAAAQSGGRLILEARVRYESIEQDGLPLRAQGATLRTKIGGESAPWHGLTGLVEIEDTRRLTAQHYNIAVAGGASLNGRTGYPTINDPQMTEVNRAQLSWKPSDRFSVIAGRQRITLEDGRFVASSLWRQDELTYDGLRGDLAAGPWKATYIYLDRVNRVLGEKADWNADTHLLNASYAFAEPLRLQGFAYLMDFANAPTSANQTYGARLSGRVKLDGAQVTYNAAVARQTDYRGNSPSYALDYYGGDVTVAYGIATGRLSYEVLEGDGRRGFVAPIGQQHAVLGWADAWSATGGTKTFVDGVSDFNVQTVLRPKFKSALAANPQLIVRYHDFAAQRTGDSLAHEWDAEATVALTPRLSLGLQFADFQAVRRPSGRVASPASRTKYMLSLEYRL
jgi:hypothetical protein